LDRDHSSSLQGATEALKASTLRLPVVGKAVVSTLSFCLNFCRQLSVYQRLRHWCC